MKCNRYIYRVKQIQDRDTYGLSLVLVTKLVARKLQIIQGGIYNESTT